MWFAQHFTLVSSHMVINVYMNSYCRQICLFDFFLLFLFVYFLFWRSFTFSAWGGGVRIAIYIIRWTILLLFLSNQLLFSLCVYVYTLKKKDLIRSLYPREEPLRFHIDLPNLKRFSS